MQPVKPEAMTVIQSSAVLFDLSSYLPFQVMIQCQQCIMSGVYALGLFVRHDYVCGVLHA